MAIKADSLKSFTEGQRNEIKRWEALIDSFIEENMNARDQSKTFYSNYRNAKTAVDKYVIEELTKRYKKAGWKLEYSNTTHTHEFKIDRL